MRLLGPGVLLWCLACPALAQDSALERVTRLNREGAELGRAGSYAQAIERFKAAEALVPRHIHDCNIGRAYYLWGKLPQALLFLERCQARAAGPVEPWVKRRAEEILTRVQAGGFAPVDVTVVPSGAELAIVSLDPSERWTIDAHKRIWLALGEQRLEVSAPGRRRQERALTLSGPLALAFTLEENGNANANANAEAEAEAESRAGASATPGEPVATAGEPVAVVKAPVVKVPDGSSLRTWAWLPAGVGLASLVASGVFFGLRLERRAALDTELAVDRAFQVAREATQYGNLALGLGVAGGVAALGAVLLAVVGAPPEVRVGGRLDPQGGQLSVWASF